MQRQNVTRLSILVYNVAMVTLSMPPSLEPLFTEARDSAQISAGASGVPAGAWPSQLVRTAAAIALLKQILDNQRPQPAPAGLRIEAPDSNKNKINS